MIFPIKAMIFDADGVLLDSLSVWKELGKRYITDLGYQPVAGMAPGVDRMIMLLRNEDNIREVIAFPMNGNAQDLMCGAPGEVTEQQQQ